MRHGECIINEQGDKEGLTAKGEQQIQHQVKNVIETFSDSWERVVIFHNSKNRSIETARILLEHFESRAELHQLPILSNSFAAKKILTHNWYLVPFILFLLPWLQRLKARLPPSPRSLNDIRNSAGNLVFLIEHLMICYQKKFRFDLSQWEEIDKKECTKRCDTYIFIGSEASLQAACREFTNETLHNINDWKLMHGDILEISAGSAKKHTCPL